MKMLFISFLVASNLLCISNSNCYAMWDQESEADKRPSSSNPDSPNMVNDQGRSPVDHSAAAGLRADENLPARSAPPGNGLVFPDIARGHEEVYRRFTGGKLIYRPNPKSDEGKIELFIRDLANPLEGEFNLAQCGDSGRVLSINTGYRKGKRPENANKVEIWIAPRFLIERNLQRDAAHFQPIMREWGFAEAPGVFWTYGGGDLQWYDHLTSHNFEDLSNESLFEKWRSMESRQKPSDANFKCYGLLGVSPHTESKHFQFSFPN